MNKKSVDVLLYCDIGKREPVKWESTQSRSYFSPVILFIGLTVVGLDLWGILYFSHWGLNVFFLSLWLYTSHAQAVSRDDPNRKRKLRR